MHSALTVVPSGEIRAQLPSLLKRFEDEGERAEPVIFGPHRRPEGVIMSYRMFERLMDVIDDLAIEREVKQTLTHDNGSRVEVAELAAEAGLDPAKFAL